MRDPIKNAVSAFSNYEGLYNAAKTKIGMSDANTLIYQLSGKYIKDTATSTFYKATLKYEDIDVDMEVANDEALWFLLSPIGSAPNNATMNNLRVSGKVPVIKLVLEKVGAKGVITITENRTHLQDQPYDMFCIPYSDDMLFKHTDSGNTFISPYTKSLAMSFAQQLAADLGNEVVYDVQILPYCPVPNLYTEEEGSGVMTYRDVAATYIEDGNGNPISAIFWAATSAFSLEIPYTIELPQSALDRKLMSVCQKYRMCSPNMASFFDFDPILNDGVATIEVDCYYKPYNPYIHLNPRFGGIYGSAEYEVRGLDLAGNFSLTQITNAWTEYQLQNKNFETIFNRQQESLLM